MFIVFLLITPTPIRTAGETGVIVIQLRPMCSGPDHTFMQKEYEGLKGGETGGVFFQPDEIFW